MADEPLVLRDRTADGVVTVTWNRPDRHNGLNTAMVEQAIAVLESVWADDEARVLVVTGAGPSFCSGMDLGEPVRPDELTFMRRVGRICSLIHDLPLPVISRVTGDAVGFGANLALCADLVLAGKSAVFGEIFAERGLGIDGGGSWLLPRLLGLGRAKEIMFLAGRVTGPEAAEMGLVNRCVPDEVLDDHVSEWAGRLANGPRKALSTIKSQLNASYERSFTQALEAEAVGQSLAFRSRESREGAKAFMEKRAPDFRSG